MESDSERDPDFEGNALALLKAQHSQLESDTYDLRKQLKADKERLERLSSQLHLTQQQIDLFKQETQRAQEMIKDANWQFTKEVAADLAKVASPTSTLVEVAEKFLLVLDQRDRSWKAFKAVVKNFGALKALMASITADHLSEEQLNELLPIWKNQQTIQIKLLKTSKGGALLAEWISHCVEYKLKKETLSASVKKLPELERKVRTQMATIAERNVQLAGQEGQLRTVKEKIEFGGSDDYGLDENLSGISLSSLKSTGVAMKSKTDTLVAAIPPLLPMSPGRTQLAQFIKQALSAAEGKEFPNFASEGLYNEEPEREAQQEEFEIEYADASESCGACRSKFFCM